MPSFVSTPLAVPSYNMSFSGMVVGVPIATVCPVSVTPLDPANTFRPSTFDLVPGSPISNSGLTTSLISASAVMPDGRMTTFSSLTRRSIEIPAEPGVVATRPNGARLVEMDVGPSTGKIVVGTDSCQTLYSPTETSFCSTVVAPAGIPPVTVTDCDQYITFSSETLFSCAPTPAITPHPASLGGRTSMPIADTTPMITDLEDTTQEGRDGAAFDPQSTEERSDNFRRDLVYSSAPSDDIPMSLPRHLLPENQLRKRQILVSEGKPVSTDLATVTPSMLMPTHKTRDVNSVTGLPKIPRLLNSTLNSIFNASSRRVGSLTEAPNVARVFHIPKALRANYARDAVREVFHKRQVNNTTTILTDNDKMTDSVAALNLTTSITDLPTNTDSVTASNSFSLPLPTPGNRAADVPQLSPPQPTKYYAAPWYELTAGGIPTHVHGITCRGGLEPVGSCTYPDADGDTEPCECEVVEESWSLTSLTRTRVGTTVVKFDGPVVVTAPGGVGIETRLSYREVQTTTKVDVVASIVRATLGPVTDGSSIEETVYATTKTTYPSVTMTILSADNSDTDVNTETSTLDIDAAMPQQSATVLASTSISTPTDSMPIATDSLLLGGSMTTPELTPTGLDTVVDGTVLVTQTVATETVTVPPSGMDPGETPVAESLGESGPAPGVPVQIRDDIWPTDVWLAMAGASGLPADGAAETETVTAPLRP